MYNVSDGTVVFECYVFRRSHMYSTVRNLWPAPKPLARSETFGQVRKDFTTYYKVSVFAGYTVFSERILLHIIKYLCLQDIL